MIPVNNSRSIRRKKLYSSLGMHRIDCICVECVRVSKFVTCTVVKKPRKVEDLQHTAPKSGNGQVSAALEGSGRPEPQAERHKAPPQGRHTLLTKVERQQSKGAEAPGPKRHRLRPSMPSLWPLPSTVSCRAVDAWDPAPRWHQPPLTHHQAGERHPPHTHTHQEPPTS